jgi:tetratricopeptide (TPR) repeat protein
LAISRQLADQSLIAQTNLNIGRIFLRRHSYTEAERYAQLARAGYEDGGARPAKIANAYNLLGIIAQGRGDYEASESYLRRACERFRQADVPVELGRSLVNLCLAMENHGLTEETLAWFEEAAAIFVTYDLHIEYARLFNTLGTVHYKQDNLAEAEAAFRQADTPIMRRSGPGYFRSVTEMNLGNVLLIQGRFEESRSYFLKCVAGFRQVNSLTSLANSLDGLAETSIALGDSKEAIALYEEALDIVTSIPEDAFANRMEKRFQGILRELRQTADEMQ